MHTKASLTAAAVLLLAVGVGSMSASAAATPDAPRPHGWAKPSAGAAAAATAEADAAAKGTERITLIVRETDSREIDAPPAGESPGDSVLFTEDAFTPSGRLVGHDQVRCTLMFRDEVFCEATFVIDGRGEIVAEGVFGFNDERPDLAVVGGTREFRNARGQMFVLPGPTPEETTLVFALIR